MLPKLAGIYTALRHLARSVSSYCVANRENNIRRGVNTAFAFDADNTVLYYSNIFARA